MAGAFQRGAFQASAFLVDATGPIAPFPSDAYAQPFRGDLRASPDTGLDFRAALPSRSPRARVP